MANVSTWQGTWVDSGETGLVPGAVHHWVMTGFGYLDIIGVTAGPLNSDAGDQVLAISDIRTEADGSGGRRFFFTVQNVGPVRAIGYGLNFSYITP